MNTPPPPPPPPPGFGASVPGPYGGGPAMQVREHPSGTTVLVLGILGLVLCTILSPIAWVKGNSARREMDAQPQVNWTNRGSVTAGWICGIIGTVLLALVAVIFIIAIAAAAGSSS